jgi:hypothetical protein
MAFLHYFLLLLLRLHQHQQLLPLLHWMRIKFLLQQMSSFWIGSHTAEKTGFQKCTEQQHEKGSVQLGE